MNFGEYLKNLFEESGESISSVSRAIGAERTSIHKAISGERILSYKVVQGLARYFNLSIEERQKFFRLYDIVLQGEENYRNRQAVCALLNDLAAIDFYMAQPSEVTELKQGGNLITGEYAVRSTIRSVLAYDIQHKEHAEICLFLPPALNLTMELMELWLHGGEFSADQMICFESGSVDAGIKNLQVLRSVIPLCLASRGSFRPWYFFEKPGLMTITPMGYYIVTPDHLIQFAADLSAAQVSESHALVKYYTEYFHSILEHCEPLTSCTSDLGEIIQEYITGTSPNSLYILMSQPCPGRYFTSDIIKKYLIGGGMDYETLLQMAELHFSVLREIKKDYYSVFTEKGLEDMVKSRVLSDLPPEFVPPLEEEDLIMMVRQFRAETASGNVQGLIARPTELKLPEYLSIYVDDRTGLHIYTTNDFIFGAYCCNIHIMEKSICSIFMDFIKSLPGSHMVYSKEETLRLLDGQICREKPQS